MTKWVYAFGDGRAEGRADMRNLLGGKGANLAEMSNLGLPVPPGFTITTEVCAWFYDKGRCYPDDLKAQVEAALGEVTRLTGRTLGDAAKPLLVSVRSGARASMPGMMDTVLNLGLNDQTVEALAAGADKRFAYDSYRRFMQMYSNVVLGIDHHLFEDRLEDFKHDRGYVLDTDLDGDDWSESQRRLQGDRRARGGQAVPAGSARAALGRHRRGVRLVDEPARGHLSPPARHPGKLGHRRQRAGDGVRQHGRHLGDRRRLHTQSIHRREGALRRVPGQRPGRGRRRRHPHAAGPDRSGPARGQLRPAVAGGCDAGGIRRLPRNLRRARTPLPRHAGPRIHHRARQAVDAADALRQAHRQGGAEDRGRHGGRRADHPRRGGAAHRAGRRSTSCCTRRSTRRPSAT